MKNLSSDRLGSFSFLMLAALLQPVLSPSLVWAKPKMLVIYNSRNGLNVTAKYAQEGIRVALASMTQKEREQFPSIITVDIDDNSAIAAQQIGKMIEEHQPVAMLGAIRSDHALVVSDFAESRKIPFLTPLATNPKVTDGKSYTFRTCFDDRQQAELLASFIKNEKNRKRIAVLFNRSQAFSLGFADAFRASVRKSSPLGETQVTLVKGYAKTEEIDDEFIRELKSNRVDAVVIPAYQVEAAHLLGRLSPALDSSVMFFGPDSWGGGQIFHAALNPRGQSSFRAYYVEHWARESKALRTQKFLQDFERFPPAEVALRSKSTSDLGPVVAFYELIQFFQSAWSNQATDPLVSRIRKQSWNGPRGQISFLMGPTPDKPLYIFGIGTNREEFLGTYGAGGMQK